MDHQGESLAPGKSPFQAKGMLWLGIRGFIEDGVPGGAGAVAAELDEQHRAFFTQMFMAMSWYDLLPINAVADAASRILRTDKLEYVKRSALWQAKRDMAGVYKPLLASDTPETICRRYASIYSQLYDFGSVQLIREGPKSIETRVEGMPDALAWWWKRGSECYLAPVLRAAGASAPKITYSEGKPNGTRAGIQLLQFTSLTTWN